MLQNSILLYTEKGLILCIIRNSTKYYFVTFFSVYVTHDVNPYNIRK